MSAINKALSDIKFQIPRDVLNLAFLPRKDIFNKAPLAVDEYIKDKVIGKRVLIDANIVGGRLALIPLNGLKPIQVDPFTTVYQIPKIRTQGCDILSALSVNYYPYTATGGSVGSSFMTNNSLYNNTSVVSATAQRIADSFSSIPPVSVAQCDLVGPNTIYVRDQYRVTFAFFLRCILENDENLNNINPRSWLKFSKLCVLAVKSYIYNNLVIEMDKAQLYGGQELGAIKDVVDGYSDAEEQYQEFLETTWRKTSFMNDTNSVIRLIRMQVNPAL